MGFLAPFSLTVNKSKMLPRTDLQTTGKFLATEEAKTTEIKLFISDTTIEDVSYSATAANTAATIVVVVTAVIITTDVVTAIAVDGVMAVALVVTVLVAFTFVITNVFFSCYCCYC